MDSLYRAVSTGNLAAIQRASFHPFSTNATSLLSHAYTKGYKDILQFLLEDQITFFLDRKNRPPRSEYYSDTQELASNDNDQMDGNVDDYSNTKKILPKIKLNGIKVSLLHQAAFYGCTSVIKTLIADDRLKASVNEVDEDGSKPIHYASLEGHNDAVQILLQNGADPNSEGYNRICALHIAIYRGNMEMIDLLLDFGASPKRKIFVSSKPPKYPVWSSVIYFNTKTYASILHWVVVEGPVSLVDKIINKGAQVHFHNESKITPVGLALREGRDDIIQYFMKKGIHLSVDDKNWHEISTEEMALKVFRTIENTKIDSLDCSNSPKFSLLHLAASKGYPTLLHLLLQKGVEQGSLNINSLDEDGFSAVYYAINAERYDIVDQFFRFCGSKNIHMQATHTEELLPFYTKRNIMGQYDNAIVRLLELEKNIHGSAKRDAEECLRAQLGTTDAAVKARNQLLTMYELSKVHLRCYILWILVTAFILPSSLFCLDVYTDVILAVEYYNDYVNIMQFNDTQKLGFPEVLMIRFDEPTEKQGRSNLMLTIFFILTPMCLLSCWNVYVHIAREDILPPLRAMSQIRHRWSLRNFLYFLLFVPPIGPIFSFIENSYIQIMCVRITSEDSNKTKRKMHIRSQTTTTRPDEEYFRLKRTAQGRVAIIGVLEATLESAFQLILQLYILGTQYTELTQVSLSDITLGSILSITPADDPQSRLPKQILCVVISLLSLTWSFTAYHRFSKSGGLSIFSSIPLLLAIFFQIVSRAIACTVFVLAYTWRIFIVLGLHFIFVFFLKVALEKPAKAHEKFVLSCIPLFGRIRPYFYVILGAFSSTFVYFRIQRPLDEDNDRHSSFLIQILFLCLVFLENVTLFGLGIKGLQQDYDDQRFQMAAGVLCLFSFVTGVALQLFYYRCCGHPWVNINGPRFYTRPLRVLFFRDGNRVQWICNSCTLCQQVVIEPKKNEKLFMS